MDSDDFHIVLPSNVKNMDGSSIHNKPNEYRTLLPQPFEVERPSQWEVQMSAISYPQTFSRQSLQKNECSFKFGARKYSKVFRMWMDREIRSMALNPSQEPNDIVRYNNLRRALGEYMKETKIKKSSQQKQRMISANSNSSFADASNAVTYLNTMKPKTMGKFRFNVKNGKISIDLGKYEYIKFSSQRLANALGFDDTLIKGRKISDDSTGAAGDRESNPTVFEDDVGRTEVVDEEEVDDASEDDSTSDDDDDDTTAPPISAAEKMNRRFQNYLKYLRVKSNKGFYQRRSVMASRIPEIKNICYNIFVYSNLVGHTLVGNAMVPLLRAIPIDHDKDGKYIGISFQNDEYRPLAESFFAYIDIKITDDNGQELEFLSGKVVVTLRIRRRNELY